MKWITTSPEETEAVAEGVANTLIKSNARRVFLSLVGEMGVGKTAFARGFGRALGIGNVHSPTFTVVNEHKGNPLPLFHFDLYRLQSEDDLLGIGFDDYLSRDGFLLCEWSENADDLLPRDRVVITIARVEGKENCREIEAKGGPYEDTCA